MMSHRDALPLRRVFVCVIMERVELFWGLLLLFVYFCAQQRRLNALSDFTRRKRERKRKEEEAYLRALTRYAVYRRARAVKLYRVLQTIRRPPVAWTRRRSTDWWDQRVPHFSPRQWVENFRMSEQTFAYLCDRLRPALEKEDTRFRCCVPHRKRVGIALWKLGTNTEYRTISRLFGVGITTVWRCTKEFCKAVADVLQRELIAPQSFEEVASEFELAWGVPQCVGAVGTCHVPVTAQRDCQDEYVNRSGRHSIVLQAVADARGRFWDISAGYPGSLHDARVMRLSRLWDLAIRGELFPRRGRTVGGQEVEYFIIGDASYPDQPWLLKPFSASDGLTEHQRRFNARISGARGTVRTALDRLRGRWRCLLKRNNCDVELATQMTVACCVLHNLCERRAEEFLQDWDDVPLLEQPNPEPPEVHTFSPGATRVQDKLMRHFSDAENS